MDLGSGPGQTHGLDGLSPSPVARVTRNRDDALHLQGQLDTSVCWSYTHGVRELALCFFTSGTTCGTKGVPERVVWCCAVFFSESDVVLHRSFNCGPRVHGRLLHPITDKMESSSRAGQVALGHVSTIIMLELFGFMRRVPGGLAARRAGRDPDAPTHHDAVHGLRAAPEPDATVCETFTISQFITLVEQDLLDVKFSSYERKRYASTKNVRHPHGPGHGLLPGVIVMLFSDITVSWLCVLPLSY